jgi:hypothetical protein
MAGRTPKKSAKNARTKKAPKKKKKKKAKKKPRLVSRADGWYVTGASIGDIFELD